jgi:O-antigen ligase/polysaccharide polymerase Wzy-like membrane protein
VRTFQGGAGRGPIHTIEGGAQKGPLVSATIAAGAILLLALTVAAGLPTAEVGIVLAIGVVAAVGYRVLLRWHVQLVFLLLVILFIPIKRYGLPGNMPFDLEPYRLVVMLLLAGWVTSLLVDPRTRLRASGLEGPLMLIAFGSLGSVLANGPRIDELEVGADVIKSLMFLFSFLVVFYMIVSVIRAYDHVRLLVQVLVACGAFVAVFAVVEAQTGFNLFNKLADFIPLLSLTETIGDSLTRGGRLRVFASSQGPIPLGSALVMILPMAIYLARTAKTTWPWWITVGCLALGALATGSRTSVVMMAVVALVFLWLRPAATRRALALLLIPAIFAVHLVLPGTIGQLRASFFPQGGLIAEQQSNPGYRGSGRLADVGPTLDEFVEKPLLGQGYGTRITGRGLDSNALILDNQWLKTLVETGAVGALAWIWLFVRFARRIAPRAKADPGERGWLLASLVAGVLAFAVGQFFYDAFSFIQVTFLLYIMLALGCVMVMLPARAPRARSARRIIRPSPAPQE